MFFWQLAQNLPFLDGDILDQFSFLHDTSKLFVRLSEEEANKWKYLLEIFFKEFNLHRRESAKVLRSYLNILLFDLERLYDPSGFVVNNSPSTPIKSPKSVSFLNT